MDKSGSVPFAKKIDMISYCTDIVTGKPYAMVKDGRLVIDHEPGGPYPVVIPCSGVKLIVNGRERTQLTPISIQDTVEIEVMNEQKEGKWSVTISADGLQAILRVTPAVRIKRELADSCPTNKLQLVAIEKEERFPPLTWNELLQELDRQGIKHEIDWEACSRGVTSCAEEEIVIAQGIPPKAGNDGRVELLFHPASKMPISAEEEEIIDFRERYVFTSVVEGEILAIKHPPGLGTPGTSVKGDVILPPPPKDVALFGGEGVVLTKDGKRAVATRAGRPVASTTRNAVRVSIIPELVNDGDVDLSSGNINFNGDVLISGNVEEGMEVKAGGNIRIGGLVSRARIHAAGSIWIRGNILSSVVIAGVTATFTEGIISHVRTLADGLTKLTLAIEQLYGYSGLKHSVQNKTGQLLYLLINDKYNYLIASLKAIQEQVKVLPTELISSDLQNFIQEVDRVLVHSPRMVHDFQELKRLTQWALEWEKNLVSPMSSDSHVVASNVVNTEVVAAGDVKITGGGCYNSRIQADKNVIVNGVFRGGEIQAQGNVHIGELGSKGGGTTRVLTGPEAIVTIGLAHENALVLLGGNGYRFLRKEKNVRLKLDDAGNLIYHGTPV